MINKENYKKLCFCCDQLLINNDSTVERVSICWLHVIREHPIILKKYDHLFSDQNGFKPIKKWINIIIDYFRIFYHLFQSIFTNSNNILLGNFKENKRIDYLFVSHLIESAGINNEIDFYFGNVIMKLEAENFNVMTLFINQTNNNISELKSLYVLPNKRILLSKYLKFKCELKLLFHLWKERNVLKSKLVNYQNESLQGKVIKEASIHCISNLSVGNLRYYYQFKDVINKYNPRNVVTTYEGHAWERLLFCAAKDHKSIIHTMGYQHTSLFRFQHSALRKLRNVYNPDVILTTGQASKSRFENSDIGFGKKIAILGSNRGKDIHLNNVITNASNNSCIVIPEGNDSECIILFRYTILCSKLTPEVNFILKLHPIMKKNIFLRKYPEFRRLPVNVKWASDNILFDFSKCKWALYRGTTMIVQACYAGLVPLYLKINPDEMSIDLLDEVSNYKDTLYSADDFLAIISRKIKYPPDYEHVINYCDSLYNPFDHNIIKLLSNCN